MINDYPELDDLLKGIDAPDLPIDENLKGTAVVSEKNEVKSVPIEVLPKDAAHVDSPHPVASSQPSDMEQQWSDFLNILQSDVSKGKKDFHNVIRLDHDLAATLDECDIDGHSRSDIANAIICAFVPAYLPRLATFRKKMVSLLDSFNPQEP